MKHHLLAITLLCAPVCAQVVTAKNDGPVPFEGYVRTVVDVMPPHRIGVVTANNGSTYPYFLGRAVGVDTRCIDVRMHLEAGETVTLNLTKSSAFAMDRESLPADPIAWFGGLCTLRGTVLQRNRLEFDGAGYLVHLRGRVGRMLHADVWIHWCPPQPWARGEVLLIASNPAVADMAEEIPEDLTLRFGDADVLVPGRRVNAPLVDAHEFFADGQGRAMPVLFTWKRHMATPLDWSSVGALSASSIGAVGIQKLWVQGNPSLPPGFDPVNWQRSRLAESVRRLHTWDRALTGGNPTAMDTGQQPDQTFVAGECMVKGGVGCERIYYHGALKCAARPCHHLEANGDQVAIEKHPQSVFWYARPMFLSAGQFPDHLGKDRGLLPGESHGWAGPDEQHWLYNALAMACRLTGSPCCQHLLRAQGCIYPFTWRLGDDTPYHLHYQPRAIGWEAAMLLHFARDLEDREMATRCTVHYLNRLSRITVPRLAEHADAVMDWAGPDIRLGVPVVERWVPWQQGLAAYFLDCAGERLGHDGARKEAMRAAKKVLVDGYVWTGERWTTYNAPSRTESASGGVGGYEYFGTLLAVAVVLRHDPTNERARSIWTQFMREASDPVHFAWVAPGVK